ncbi:MAG: EAL domain-containing protein [Poseidonibacter sp.]|uniref:EAL domain-containing protein n=1 Tax=Poseidonibacter sp. TaxID=2321188 RepID=UPI00359E4376
MKNFDFKSVSIVVSSLLVFFMAIDFKSKLSSFNSSYYSATSMVHELENTWHKHINILEESIILLHFNNDKLVTHKKIAKEKVSELNKNVDIKNTFPLLYDKFDNYLKEYSSLDLLTERFIRSNSMIKNSILILEKRLYDLGTYDEEYRTNFLDMLLTVKNAKNNYVKNGNITEKQFNYFKNNINNDEYKLNFAHINFLYNEIPKFHKSFNTIKKSNITNIIDEMFIALEKESKVIKEKMQTEFIIIMFVYLIFLIILLLLILKIKKDSHSLVNYQKQKELSLKTDDLTQLPNRNAFNYDTRNNDKYSVILLDIVDFSNINSITGYQGGDHILKNVADVIKEAKTHNVNYKRVYRVGVDQFAVVIDSKDVTVLDSVSLGLISEIENTIFDFKGFEVPVYIQAGITQKKPYLKSAELAIAQTKNSFEKVSYYNDDIDIKQNAVKNIEMLSKVKEAIKDNRIRPFFQGIVDLQTKEPVKYEALVRLIDTDGRAISPYFFLELTKKSKLYSKITNIVIKKSIEFIRQNNISVSINLSFQDINNASTLTFISLLLQTNKDIAHLITFEILESEEVQNYESIFKFAELTKEFGCKLAIDDFGSGYSNFTQLFKMKPDILKLDGSLIKDIHINDNSKHTVEAMIFLAKKSNIQTVAEFVDNEIIDKMITELGIDYGQGFYYSEPKDLLKEEE